MVVLSSLEKSMELRSIKKAKEKYDGLNTKECYLSSKDIASLDNDLDNERKTLEKLDGYRKRAALKDSNNDKKILLEDVRLLKEMTDSGYQYESWMLPELQKIEKQLTEEEILQENWTNISNKNYDEILENLEKRYRNACEEHNAGEIENIFCLIRFIKRKHIDSEIGKNILAGKCNEDIISFNSQIDNITRKI